MVTLIVDDPNMVSLCYKKDQCLNYPRDKEEFDIIDLMKVKSAP